MDRMRLSNHKYSQCHVLVSPITIDFISYSTLVIHCEKDLDTENTWNIWCSGTYSPTTRKQIGWFLKEYFGDLSYYDMKQSAATGEIFRAEKKHAKFW